jgi:hypothetical protein
MALSEQQQAAIRNIRTGWGDLSLGDVSIICAVLREPGDVMTCEGTAHARFWQNLVRLGWAEKLYSPIDPETVPIEMLSFKLNEEGHASLPHFLIFYDLLNMGACAPAARSAVAPAPPPPPTEEPVFRWPRAVAIGAPVLAALIVAMRPGGGPFAFFLFTYSGMVALLTQPARADDAPGRAIRGVAGVNALFLGISTLPLLLR